MSDLAIRVENLSKQYRLGQRESYKSLREIIIRSAIAPIRYLKKISGSPVDRKRVEKYFWALKDVSFEVKQGEVLGIIGRNGAGKSTLLKILSRITKPTQGIANLYGRVGSLLEVGTGFHPELSGRENIFLNGAILGMKRAEILRKFDEIVSFAEIEQFLDTPVKHYSSGMFVRLAFAVAAHLEPEILLVDEVLAVGDVQFQTKCLGKMEGVAREGRTVLFVSHNLAAVANLCQTAILLDKGHLISEGSPLSIINRYIALFSSTHNGNLFDHINREGQGPLKFTSIIISNDENIGNSQLISGQMIKLILNFEIDEEMSYVTTIDEVSIQIYTSQGFQIANLSTYYFGDFPYNKKLHKNGFFTCVIPELPLRRGSYYLELYCSINNHLSDWVHHAFTFDVIDGDYFHTGRLTKSHTGYTFIDHHWT